jgi:hypothetical protein
MDKLEIRAIKLFQFSSKQDWINNASRLFAKYKNPEDSFAVAPLICVDTTGHLCAIGADFQEAENKGSYPISVYRLTRLSKYLQS